MSLALATSILANQTPVSLPETSPFKEKAQYQAKAPCRESEFIDKAKLVTATVIFPVGLLWIVQKIVRYISTFFITKYYKTDPLTLQSSHQTLKYFYPEYSQQWMRSHDGTLISFLHFPSADTNAKKVIFVAPGLGSEAANMALTWKDSWKDDFGDAHVVFVDPRGVGLSDGFMDIEKGADDVYSVADYYINKLGIKPSNCLFWGFSLGGGTASRAAKLLQRTYPEEKINLVHQNSFRKFTIAAQHLLGGWYGFLSRIGLFLINQELTPETDTKKLKGTTVVIYNIKDDVILHDATYHPKGPNYQVFPICGEEDPSMGRHIHPIAQDEKIPIREAIRALWA